MTYDPIINYSLIELLKRKNSIQAHPLLNVTYGQVVGEKANIFVSFAYEAIFDDLINAINSYLDNHPDLPVETTYFWFDMLVNDQWYLFIIII